MPRRKQYKSLEELRKDTQYKKLKCYNCDEKVRVDGKTREVLCSRCVQANSPLGGLGAVRNREALETLSALGYIDLPDPEEENNK